MNNTSMFTLYPDIDKISHIGKKANYYLCYPYSRYSKKFFRINKCVFFVDHRAHRVPNKTTLESLRYLYGAGPLTKTTFPTPIESNIELDQINNAILIIPDSFSYSSEIVKKTLKLIEKICIEKKINVFVNTKDDNWTGVKVMWDFNTLLLLAKHFKYIIGIRTGLFDLLANASANLICLYGKDPGGIFMKEKIYPLSDWKGTSTIVEKYADDLDVDYLQCLFE